MIIKQILRTEHTLLATTALLLDKAAERQTRELLAECRDIHHKRVSLLEKIVADEELQDKDLIPPSVRQLLLSDKTTDKDLLDFVNQLETRFLELYTTWQSDPGDNQIKECLTDFTKEQEKLCSNVNVLLQSLTYVREYPQ